MSRVKWMPKVPLFAGFLGSVPRSTAELPSPYPCLLAQADNPCRLVQRNDDSDVGSSACPYAARLDGIPDRIPGDRLFSPLLGLMVSRYPRGDAFTSTPEGQELHLHGEEVVRDQLISAPYPPQPLRGCSFRETDRTCSGVLGVVSGMDANLPTNCEKTVNSSLPQIFLRRLYLVSLPDTFAKWLAMCS